MKLSNPVGMPGVLLLGLLLALPAYALSTFVEQAKLTPSDAVPFHYFGSPASLGVTRAVHAHHTKVVVHSD